MMMNTTRNFFFVTAILLLTACGGLSKNYRPDASTGKGLVIASVSQENFTANVFVWIRGIKNHDFVPSISGIPNSNKANLSVFEVPAGEYEFHRMSSLTGTHTLNAKYKRTFKFKVEAGKAVYVGNLFLVAKGQEGKTVRFSTGIRDNRKIDLADFKKRFPNVPDNKIVIGLAKN